MPRLVQAALATTIVFVVFGSSSVHALHTAGTSLRWVALALFVVLALLWALRDSGDAFRTGVAAIPAGLLLALALLSTIWSVAPLLSFERSVSIGLVLVGAACLVSVRQRQVAARMVAEAIVAATTLVCLAGPVVYAFVPSEARQAANPISPFRWAGLGENPDTVPLLAALALLPAAWLALTGSGRRRALLVLAGVVFGAQIVTSGSRDGAISAAIGVVVFALLGASTPRVRVAWLAAAVAVSGVLVGGVAAMNHTTNARHTTPPPPAPAKSTQRHPRIVLPSMDYELGTISAAPRSFLVAGGRGQAIREGIDQANERPVAGWGFGTEERVFVNRVAAFRSNVVENSYVGLYLQLGALGPLLFLALGLWLAWAVLRRIGQLSPELRLASAALAAMVATGYALGVGQSYVYAAGNVATLPFWIAVFLTAALVAQRLRISKGIALAALGIAGATLAAVAVTGRSEGASIEHARQLGIARLWHHAGASIDRSNVDGFRLFHPYACLLYADRGVSFAYEFCFDKHSKRASLLEAIERGPGLFRDWNLRAYGPSAATIFVPSDALVRRLLALGAGDPTVVDGPAYLAPAR